MFLYSKQKKGEDLIKKREGPMDIKIYEARTKRKLTLQDLAMLSGVSKSTLNRIENGITSPNMAQMEAIAKAMNAHITELFESDFK